jgi:hypothetical protein
VTSGLVACIDEIDARPGLRDAHRRCTNDVLCGLDYARGGGSSGGNACDGGVSTTIAMTRSGGQGVTVLVLAKGAMSAVRHGPIAWHTGQLIR